MIAIRINNMLHKIHQNMKMPKYIYEHKDNVMYIGRANVKGKTYDFYFDASRKYLHNTIELIARYGNDYCDYQRKGFFADQEYYLIDGIWQLKPIIILENHFAKAYTLAYEMGLINFKNPVKKSISSEEQDKRILFRMLRANFYYLNEPGIWDNEDAIAKGHLRLTEKLKRISASGLRDSILQKEPFRITSDKHEMAYYGYNQNCKGIAIVDVNHPDVVEFIDMAFKICGNVEVGYKQRSIKPKQMYVAFMPNYVIKGTNELVRRIPGDIQYYIERSDGRLEYINKNSLVRV